MTKDRRREKTDAAFEQPGRPWDEGFDESIARKVKMILKKGYNAEIKRKADGTIAVMEVKKQIV